MEFDIKFLLQLTVSLNFNVSYYHVISYSFYESLHFITIIRNAKNILADMHLFGK